MGSLSKIDRILTITGGFLIILLTTLLALIIQAQTSPVPLFDQFVRPFSLAAAGIGTGHYLGRAIRNNDSIRSHFALGFFVGIFLESIYFTFSQSIGKIPLPAVVVVGTLLALIMHFSPIVPEDEDLTKLMNVYMGPSLTLFVIFTNLAKFILSFDLSWQYYVAGLGVVIVIIWIAISADSETKPSESI